MQNLAKSALRFLNRIAAMANVQLSRKGSLGRNWDTLFSHLKACQLSPQVIIDVGVADGTDDLYRHFPNAKYYLVEALTEFEPGLKRLCTKLNAEYVLAAAGPEQGQIEINVHPDLIGSSVHREVSGVADDGAPRTVEMIRIDDLLSDAPSGPRLIKIDVQGAELSVLRGAETCLQQTDVVILETSLIGTLADAPELNDVVRYMKERGFVVFDMIGGLERPLDRHLAQVDLVFVPETHALRTDRRWRSTDAT